MQGLMQTRPLLLSSLITHAARWFPKVEVVSRTGAATEHRTTYAGIERRARRLARVLERLGVRHGDRIGTLAWNGYRHLELYWAVSGIGAICHTINPRLAHDDIAYIATDAGDSVIFVDLGLTHILTAIASEIAACVCDVVVLAEMAEMPDIVLPAGMRLHCYETLMAGADDDYAWPEFDETSASALCYTSGTTGRPKGVLYSHRSAMLHALSANGGNAYGLRSGDRIFMATSMFHATAWGWPYCAAMAGAAVYLPGRWLDGPTVVQALNAERITFSGGVPTIWHGVLDTLRRHGGRLDTLRRIMIGGSALPQSLVEGFADYGVDICQAWGMTETSPVVAHHMTVDATAALPEAEQVRLRLKQGRPIWGADIRIVDNQGEDLPWNGVAFGDLLTRGHWVCREYLGRGQEGGADADGWFATGDVATIDDNGYVELVDRSKDVIKSGGEWISSIALENIAAQHPGVAEAAVIKARHPKWEERPLLLVVPREGRDLDPASVLAIFEGKVAKWWIPDAVVVVPDLPHGATGKLNKLVLRQAYGDYLLR
jgi:fatty-acyl-CoA synthase